MNKPEQVPVWFFVGVLLLVYGAIIAMVGVYHLFPQQANPDLAMQWLHADLWWGALLTLLGGFYTARYRPRRKR
jgi:hypothetical protein